ncbi:hypothetical protein ACMFMG_003142 [Clarireedia jacksonii]
MRSVEGICGSEFDPPTPSPPAHHHPNTFLLIVSFSQTHQPAPSFPAPRTPPSDPPPPSPLSARSSLPRTILYTSPPNRFFSPGSGEIESAAAENPFAFGFGGE